MTTKPFIHVTTDCKTIPLALRFCNNPLIFSLSLSLSLCTTFCQCNNLNNNISDILNIYIKKLTGLRIHVSYTTPHRYRGVQTLLRLIIQRLIPIHQDLFTLFDIISSGMNLLNSIRYKPCPPPQHLFNHFG